MNEFLHQLASGLALGGVYAIMALALVMIYQATQLVNFAQGEMAMFSTYFAWKLMDAGWPYWRAFAATVARLVRRRRRDRAHRRAPLRQGAGARLGDRVHRPCAHLQCARRLALRLFGHIVRHAVFGPAVVRQRLHVRARIGRGRRDLLRARARLRLLPLHPARPRHAGRGAEPDVEPPGRHPGRLDAGDRLGARGGDRRDRRA